MLKLATLGSLISRHLKPYIAIFVACHAVSVLICTLRNDFESAKKGFCKLGFFRFFFCLDNSGSAKIDFFSGWRSPQKFRPLEKTHMRNVRTYITLNSTKDGANNQFPGKIGVDVAKQLICVHGPN